MMQFTCKRESLHCMIFVNFNSLWSFIVRNHFFLVMGIFELQFYFGSLSINFQTYQDKNVCICMNEFNKYHYNYYFTERSFICVLYWKLMFLLFLGEGTRLLASLVKNGRSAELMRNVVKCQGIPPLVAMVSSEHLVMQNEALVALTLISSTVLGLSSQGQIESCKL